MENGKWKSSKATSRTLDFELGGVGSRSVPISRPQLLILRKENSKQLVLIYRDEEVDNNVVLATSPLTGELQWASHTIIPYPVDRWEPSYDTELLKNNQTLHLYFQCVGQGQGETTVSLPPQPVGILEIEM